MIMIIIRAVTITTKIALMMIKKKHQIWKSTRGKKEKLIKRKTIQATYTINLKYEMLTEITSNTKTAPPSINICTDSDSDVTAGVFVLRPFPASKRPVDDHLFFSFLSPLIKMFGVGNVDCDWIKRRRNMYFKSSLCLLSFESFRGKIESL